MRITGCLLLLFLSASIARIGVAIVDPGEPGSVAAAAAPEPRGDETGGPISILASGTRRGDVVDLIWRWNPPAEPGPGYHYYVRRKIHNAEEFDQIAILPRDPSVTTLTYRDTTADPLLPYRYRISAGRTTISEFRSRPMTFAAQRLALVGEPVTLFDASKNGCGGLLHFSDGPLRMLRLGGNISGVISNMTTFRAVLRDPAAGVGTGSRPLVLREGLFDTFPCRPLFVSRFVPEPPYCPTGEPIGAPEDLRNMEWLWSPWIDRHDPSRVYALVHNEYHDCIDDEDRQYNCITAIVSNDAGRTFEPVAPPPRHVVAVPPVTWDPTRGPNIGYHSPSNIIEGRRADGTLDGYYYALAAVREIDLDGPEGNAPEQEAGVAVLRTRSLDPASPEHQWRAWVGNDGTGAVVYRPFSDPYRDTIVDPRKHAVRILSPYEVVSMHSSIAYSEVLGEYILVGVAKGLHTGVEQEERNARLRIYYAISTNKDLTGDWTPRELLLDELVSFDATCDDGVQPVLYPSIFDLDSRDPNYTTLPDDEFVLTVTRFNWDDSDACGSTLDRDVVAYPVRIVR